MSNKCPTCSQPGAERSNPQGEARRGEPASRNAIELDSASLRYMGAANLPEMVKPATVGEATLERNRQAPRGGWSQRVGKESRNLGGPADGGKVGKAAGIDGVRAGDILAEENGVEKFLATLHEELKTKGYKSEIFGRTPAGLNMVCYNSFSEKAEALKLLEKVRKEENKSAYIYHK